MSEDGKARRRTIKVGALARVEGEGALEIEVRGDRVTRARLRIYEPPRFFEALLRGRHADEAHDVTARICGICPVAYQMSTVHAIEAACGVRVEGPLRDLRRLLYCGEWIQSHALHIHLLHAPDFLGYESAVHMAKDHKDVVERGLELKKAGNRIMERVGGRAIHPINVRLGGFHRVPEREEIRSLREPLARALAQARETVRWVAGFDFPALELDHEVVALRHPDEYPMNEGRIVSSRGLDIAVDRFEEHFEERHEKHSTALYSRRGDGGGPYLVGPAARFQLNFDRLAPAARAAADEVGLAPPVRNPFRSIIVRAVEVVHACAEALALVEAYQRPERPFVPVPPRAAEGSAATEAPRGLLFHRFRLAADGTIEEARITPPTAQNQAAIEVDLKDLVSRHLDQERGALTRRCEQAIRNYDPCISCATHFLTLDVVHADGAGGDGA